MGMIYGVRFNNAMEAKPMNFFTFITFTLKLTRRTCRHAARPVVGRGGVMGGAWVAPAQGMPVAAWALKPSPEYAQYPRYVGTLGTQHITLRLGKPESQAGQENDPTARQGEYQFDAKGDVLRIAGVRDGDVFEAEDSADGENIAGNWTGLFAADGSLQGTRTNADNTHEQPFDLKLVAAPEASDTSVAHAPVPASAPVQPAAATAPGAASAPGNRHSHPVEGVSNLSTED
jgi:hypothetical protein